MSGVSRRRAKIQRDDLYRVLTDDELTLALASDLDGAFEHLVRAYQQRLFGFALRVCTCRQDAEEVAQDAFVRAYRAMATYPAERIRALRLAPWLIRIALNVARNRAERHALATFSLDEPDDDGHPRDAADERAAQPEDLAVAGELRCRLEGALEHLPAHWRLPVVLRHVEGLTYLEIAEALGQPAGTVKSAVHRGTAMLRDMLRETRAGERAEVR